MKSLHIFLLLVVLVFGVTACKYDEGPLVSFVSRTDRVANTWVVNSATINGTTSTIPNLKKVNFFHDGGAQIFYTLLGVDFAYSGTWVFNDKKVSIHIDLNDDLTHLATYVNDWTILHLKDKILKVTYTEPTTSGTDLYVVEFKPEV